MKKFALLFAVALVGVVWLMPSAVIARSIPGAPNEVDDPWFQNLQVDWYVNTQTGGTAANPGNLPGNYYDPGRNPGDVAFLRTIVDDMEGLWNPDFNRKEIDFSMYAHIVGGGYISVRFDWWLDPTIPEPSNDPNLSPTPDGVSQWYFAAAPGYLPGDFADRPDLMLPGEDPGWFTPDFSESFLLNIHQVWDVQPRWVSIEIEAGVDPLAEFGGEALFTGVDFEAGCVPSPSVGVAGLMLLGSMTLRRRR
jgi:hypothetical protein